jgi:hypothetical protein
MIQRNPLENQNQTSAMLLLTRLHRIGPGTVFRPGRMWAPDELDSMRRKAEGGGLSWQGRATREADFECCPSAGRDFRNPGRMAHEFRVSTSFGCLRARGLSTTSLVVDTLSSRHVPCIKGHYHLLADATPQVVTP